MQTRSLALVDLPLEVQDLVVAFLMLQDNHTDHGQALLSLRSCSKSMQDFGAAACKPAALQQMLVESSAWRLFMRAPPRLWRMPGVFDQVAGWRRHCQARGSRTRLSARLQGVPPQDPLQLRQVKQLSEETCAAADRLSSKADALDKLQPAACSGLSWAQMRVLLDMTYELVQDMNDWCKWYS